MKTRLTNLLGEQTTFIGESNTGVATGICYRTPDGNVETLQSDLIIDASGNGSLTLEFLKASGRRAPEETSIGVNMRYASALFDHANPFDLARQSHVYGQELHGFRPALVKEVVAWPDPTAQARRRVLFVPVFSRAYMIS